MRTRTRASSGRDQVAGSGGIASRVGDVVPFIFKSTFIVISFFLNGCGLEFQSY